MYGRVNGRSREKGKRGRRYTVRREGGMWMEVMGRGRNEWVKEGTGLKNILMKREKGRKEGGRGGERNEYAKYMLKETDGVTAVVKIP